MPGYGDNPYGNAPYGDVSLIAIKAAVVAAVKAVDGAGDNAYYYQPYVKTDAALKATFGQANGPLLGWTVARESTAARDRTVGGVEETHLLVLRGYHAINEDGTSELAFEALVEAVRAALRSNRTLTFTAFITNPPPSVRTAEARMYCGVLVHYAEIALYAQEYPV